MKRLAILVVLALQSVVFSGQARHNIIVPDGHGEFTPIKGAVILIRAYMS
jgi:hypothetical protein